MDEELIKKLYNDLALQEKGNISYDEHVANMTNRDYFIQMHQMARQYYGPDQVPLSNDFQKQLGIEFAPTPEPIAQPDVSWYEAIPSAGKTAWNTGKYTIPAAVSARQGAGKESMSTYWGEQYDKIKDLPDDQSVMIPDPRNKGQMAMPMMGTAKEMREKLLPMAEKDLDAAVDKLTWAVERMQKMPVDPDVIDDYAVANDLGVGGWSSFIGYSFGQMLPQALGSMVAPGVFGATQEAGAIHIDAIERMKQEHPDKSYEDIIRERMVDYQKGEQWGAAAAGLDLLSLGILGKIASPVLKPIANQFIKQGVKQTAKQAGKRSILQKTGTVLGSMAAGGLSEGPTEYTQEWMAEMGKRAATGLDTDAPHDTHRYMNAGLAGLFPGLGLGGVGGVTQNRRNARRVDGDALVTKVKDLAASEGEQQVIGDVTVTLDEGEALVAELGGVEKDVNDAFTESEKQIASMAEGISEAAATKQAELDAKKAAKVVPEEDVKLNKEDRKISDTMETISERTDNLTKEQTDGQKTKKEGGQPSTQTRQTSRKGKSNNESKGKDQKAQNKKNAKGVKDEQTQENKQRSTKAEAPKAKVTPSKQTKAEVSTKEQEKVTTPTKWGKNVDGVYKGTNGDQKITITKNEKTKKWTVMIDGNSRGEATTVRDAKKVADKALTEKYVSRVANTEKAEKLIGKMAKRPKPKTKRGRKTGKVISGLVLGKHKKNSKESSKAVQDEVMSKVYTGGVRVQGDVINELQDLRRADEDAKRNGGELLTEKDRKAIHLLLNDEAERAHYNKYGRFRAKTLKELEGKKTGDANYRAKRARTQQQLKESTAEVSQAIDDVTGSIAPSTQEYSKVETALKSLEKSIKEAGGKITKKFQAKIDRFREKAIPHTTDAKLEAIAKDKNNVLAERAQRELDFREDRKSEARTGAPTARGVATWTKEEQSKKAREKYRIHKETFVQEAGKLLKKIYAFQRRIKNSNNRLTTEQISQAHEAIAVLKGQLEELQDKMYSFIAKPDLRPHLKHNGPPLSKASKPITKKDFNDKVYRPLTAEVKKTVGEMTTTQLASAGKLTTAVKRTPKQKKEKVALMASEQELRRKARKKAVLDNPESTESQIREVLDEKETDAIMDEVSNTIAEVRQTQEKGGMVAEIFGVAGGKGTTVYVVIRDSKGQVFGSGEVSTRGQNKILVAKKGENLVAKQKEVKTLLENRRAKEKKPSYRWSQSEEVDLTKDSKYRSFFNTLTKVLDKFGFKLQAIKVRNPQKLNANGEYVDAGYGAAFVKGDTFTILMKDTPKHELAVTEAYRVMHEAVHVLRMTESLLKQMGIEKSLFDNVAKTRIQNAHKTALNAIQKEIEEIKKGNINSPLAQALIDYVSFREKGNSRSIGMINSSASPVSTRIYGETDEQFQEMSSSERRARDVERAVSTLTSEEFANFLNNSGKMTWGTRNANGGMYGMTSLDEFMAESVTNPYFMNILDNIESTKKVRTRKTIKSSVLKEMVNTIIDMITKVFNPKGVSLKGPGKNSVYTEMVNIIDDTFYEVENAKNLANEISLMKDLEHYSFNLDDDITPPSNRAVKTVIVDKVADQIISEEGVIENRTIVDAIIINLNEKLPQGQQIDEAMGNRIWAKVKRQDGFTSLAKLAKKLSKKLTGKNHKGIRVGKWVDPDTAKTLSRLQEALVGQSSNASYTRFKELQEKEQSGEQLTPEESIDKVISMVGAFTKFDKVMQDSILENVTSIIDEGRSKFLDAQAKKYNATQKTNELVLNTLYGRDHLPKDQQYKVKNPVATYNKGDVVVHMDSNNRLTALTVLEDGTKASELNMNSGKVKVGRRLKTKYKGKKGLWGNFQETFIDSILGVEEIVDILAGKAGTISRQYRSKLVNELTRGLREASSNEILSRIKRLSEIDEARTIVLGDGSATKGIKRHRELRDTELTKEQYKMINDNHNGLFVNEEETLGTVLKRWMELNTTDVRGAYHKAGISPDALQEDLGKILPSYAKKWGKWQVAYYNALYERINKIYRQVYGADLEKIEGYSPIVATDQNGQVSNDKMDYASDMLKAYSEGDIQSKQQTVSNFKERHGTVPASVDSDAMLMSFVNKMEHFVNFAIPLSKFNGVLSNKTVRGAISSQFDSKYVKLLDDHMKTIANGNLNQGNKSWERMVNTFRNNMVTATLSMNLTLLPKQLSSFPAYVANISWNPKAMAQYTGYLAEGVANPIKVLKLFQKEGWVQARKKGGFEQDVSIQQQAMLMANLNGKNLASDIVNLKNNMVSLGMKPTKWGDIGAIMLGGYPMYRMESALLKKANPHMTEKEIHEEAMFQVRKASELSQQSPHMMDLGMIQKSGQLGRLFTMYMTSPFQYKRQTTVALTAAQNAYIQHGFNSPQFKSKMKEFIKRAMVFHVMLPSIFSLVSAGLYPPLDEEGEIDWSAIGMGAVAGSFIGFPLIGSFVKSILDKVAGNKTYKVTASPLAAFSEEMINITQGKAAKLFDDSLDWTAEDTYDISDMLLRAVGVPTRFGSTYKTNYDKQFKSTRGRVGGYTPHQQALLLLGYSEYAVPQLKMTDANGKPIDYKRINKK
jgi:hypothetical protein